MTEKEFLKAVFTAMYKECGATIKCENCKLYNSNGCILSVDLENIDDIDKMVEKVLSLPLEFECNEDTLPKNSLLEVVYGKDFKVHDNVNSPAHYCNGGIECIEAIKAATTGLQGVEGYCIGNAIKYLWRWKFKNGVEDLKKARWYINRTIQELEGANNVNS